MADIGSNAEGGALDASRNSAVEPQLHLESYLRVRDLLEAAPYAILEVNRDGTVVLLKVTAETIFGYSRQGLLGHTVEMLVPEIGEAAPLTNIGDDIRSTRQLGTWVLGWNLNLPRPAGRRRAQKFSGCDAL